MYRCMAQSSFFVFLSYIILSYYPTRPTLSSLETMGTRSDLIHQERYEALREEQRHWISAHRQQDLLHQY